MIFLINLICFFDPVSWPGEVIITLKLNSFNALIILKNFLPFKFTMQCLWMVSEYNLIINHLFFIFFFLISFSILSIPREPTL